MFSACEPASAGWNRHRAKTCWRALERGHDGLFDKRLPALADAPKRQKDERLRCRACGHAIASARDRISVQGSHAHYRANSHGVGFLFGCFDQASGSIAIGEATLEHTWFAGFRWRILLCGQCATHLGWGFHAEAGHRFCGLILDRLIAPW
jgi:hypothetical protein